MNDLQKCRKPLPVPPAAAEIHNKIYARLAALETNSAGTCLLPQFKKRWGEILDLIDRYQREIAHVSAIKISCRKGCAACCCHWVEDVNSFEAEIMAAYLKARHPEKVGRIVTQCAKDENTLTDLNAIVESKLAAAGTDPAVAGLDPVDLLLASFYRLRSPCPLLEKNRCLAYPVRPLTCRMYVSFSAPEACVPGDSDNDDIPTYLFDLDEKANEIIDALHFRFRKFKDDTGLRSLLAKYLG
jgi:Fe-S-cluster containining protein